MASTLIMLGFKKRYKCLVSRNKLYRAMIVNAKQMGTFVESREIACIPCGITQLRIFSNSWYNIRNMLPISPNSQFSAIRLDEIWNNLKRAEPKLKQLGVIGLGFKVKGTICIMAYKPICKISDKIMRFLSITAPYVCLFIGFFNDIPACQLMPPKKQLAPSNQDEASRLAVMCAVLMRDDDFIGSPYMKEYLARN